MKRIVILLIALLISGQCFAQSAANHATMTTLIPTVVPTSFPASTPGPQYNTGKALKVLEVLNTLDCDVILSFDGSNDHIIVPSGMAWSREYRANELTNGAAMYVRKTGACTTGSLYIEGAN